ncbi:phosphoenolpyruvate carboxykinase (ATP) [Spongiibacter tropicus]|uniref:phosphoenolpyruvate carboxykinase (ATP) n=1 Tax=Spongiibacter tropicus TaxID=454602 RepID=UPI0035BEA224
MSNSVVRDGGLESLGIKAGTVHLNWNEARLYEEIIRRGEGEIAEGGALVVKTGEHTGRSAKDKFTVRDAHTEDQVWWDNNASISPEHFTTLWNDFRAHMEGKELFVQQLFGGADKEHRLPVRVVNELSWHSLFIRHLLRVPAVEEYDGFDAQFTIVNLPSFKAAPERHGCRSETVIGVDFERKLVLIGGTSYAGETKKSVFTILNYLLPAKGIMPMHCSVNVGEDDDAAIFFGLSGTGKTTLSADPSCYLIGDDEHGWSKGSVFNVEGGCYAKTINLSQKNEPIIWDAIRFGAIVENVVIDQNSRTADYDDTSLTENGRCCYPLEHVEKRVIENAAGEPKTVIFLTCDVSGVLPPISILSKEAAAFHFLSGYTARVGSTELGAEAGIHPTFSTCFGAPFMPRPAGDYAELLMKRIEDFDSQVYLINTGWTGGSGAAGGTGSRFPIPVTRAVVAAAQSGALVGAATEKLDILNLTIPASIPGVDDKYVNPRKAWGDEAAYDAEAAKLAKLFQENIKKFDVSDAIVEAGPKG